MGRGINLPQVPNKLSYQGEILQNSRTALKATATPDHWCLQWYLPCGAPWHSSVRTGSDSWLGSRVPRQLTGKRKPHSFVAYIRDILLTTQALAYYRGQQTPQLSSQKGSSAQSIRAPGNSKCGLSPGENKTEENQTFLVPNFFLENKSSNNRGKSQEQNWLRDCETWV